MMHDWQNVWHQKRKIHGEKRDSNKEAPEPSPPAAHICPLCGAYEQPIHVWVCSSPKLQASAVMERKQLREFMCPMRIDITDYCCDRGGVAICTDGGSLALVLYF